MSTINEKEDFDDFIFKFSYNENGQKFLCRIFYDSSLNYFELMFHLGSVKFKYHKNLTAQGKIECDIQVLYFLKSSNINLSGRPMTLMSTYENYFNANVFNDYIFILEPITYKALCLFFINPKILRKTEDL